MLQLKINDMTCGHCVASITKAVKAVAPQAHVDARLDDHRVDITGSTNDEAVINAITQAGFPVERL